MTERKIVVGIDTSNYTTSLALMYDDGELISNIKRPLTVKAGERGLRQSDAVFSHIKNIPDIMREAKSILDGAIPVAIGVSTKPRNQEGSYMPCFLSGVAVAEGISSMLNIPLYGFSHQCGHIMAALYSSDRIDLADGNFAALHISGGTTELLDVNGCISGFKADIVGGTKDLNAGQVIDRVGVHIGMQFPAGISIEKYAVECRSKLPPLKLSVVDTYMNLSGLENMAIRHYDKTSDIYSTSAFLLECIGESISKMCENYERKRGKTTFVFAGGVMSNSIIRAKLTERFDAYFAEPAMSADNAVGIAALTLRKIKQEK